MYRVILLISLFFIPLVLTAQSFPEDCEGGKPNPFITRIPNYYLSESEEREFDEYIFFDGKPKRLEGALLHNFYFIMNDHNPLSALQLKRNFENAFKAMNATILFNGIVPSEDIEGYDWVGWHVITAKVVKGDKEIWFCVIPGSGGESYYLDMLEVQGMNQYITGTEMFKSLSETGHIALYINFAVDKSDLPSDATETIDQIVMMLNNNRNLNLIIEGHTDNTGDPAKNKTLSDKRAQSVMKALTDRGIDAKRLEAKGFGQDMPIADNRTDEGRTKNRRVELVKK